MRRLLDLLGSLRLTIGLLVALATLFLLGLTIPQKQVLRRELYTQWQAQSPVAVRLLEAAGLTDIYRSPLAVGLWIAFFSNLAVVMARRVPAIRARARIDGEIPDPASAPGFPARRTLPAGEGAMAAAAAFLRGRRFAVHERDGRLRALKHRLTPWATLAFHLCFFLIAAGGLVSLYTRFEGYVDLGVGEEFTGAVEQYAEPPRLPAFGDPPRTHFTVEAVLPELEQDQPVGIKVVLRDERMLARTIEVNRPYRVRDASFVFKNVGVAPLLVVHDAGGREVFGGYIRLNVLQGRKDAFSLVGQDLEAELFPDHVETGGVEGTRSQEMRDPVLRLTLKARTGRLAQVSLRPGEGMDLGPYRLFFVDWRYWARLYVRSERGLGVVWLGFGIGATALAVRLLLYRREVLLAAGAGPGGPLLLVAARADYYRALFEDEVDVLVAATLQPDPRVNRLLATQVL